MFCFPTNMDEFTQQQKISRSTTYRILKSLGFAKEVFETDAEATWQVYASISPANLKQFADHLKVIEIEAICSGYKHMSLNSQEFVKRAFNIWGKRYNYKYVEYTNRHTAVLIICRKHGEFFQTPQHHLTHHQGCKQCLSILTKQTKFTSLKQP